MCVSLSSHADVQVLTTIEPLRLIAAAITDGVSTPEVFLPVGASPHEYSLKPSDVAKLKQADVIFWVGPNLETFLVKPLSAPDYVHKSSALIESHGLHLRQYHDHDDVHMGANALATDPHIWLLPSNAVVIAKAMMEKLSAMDTVNKTHYQQNYEQFSASLMTLDQHVTSKLAPVKEVGYVVLHDGYGYFEEHYGLNHQGELTLSPERPPGAKHLLAIEQLIKQGKVECVFGEPQFQPRYLDSLVEQLKVRRGTVDYLGSGVTVSAQGYANFLSGLADQFYVCLSAATPAK
jgi:zinc transport system substrate-binding protein